MKNIFDEKEPIVCRCEWENYHDYRIMMPNGEGHVRVSFFQEEIIISDLFVTKGYRQKGYASILLDRVDKLLKGKVAIIYPLEEWQKEWYEKRGYVIGNKKEFLDEDVEQLKDELDALYMRYLSQVSLWKSKYKECLNKACNVLTELLPKNGEIWSIEAFVKSFKRAMEDKQ